MEDIDDTQVFLSWGGFQNNQTASLSNIFAERDFSDITLVSEGDQPIYAHKVILATGSPYFNSLLLRHPHPHPLICLPGLGSSTLQQVVAFLYKGEVRVPQEELKPFLEAAQKFQVKGLGTDQSSNETTSKELKLETMSGENEVHSYVNELNPKELNPIHTIDPIENILKFDKHLKKEYETTKIISKFNSHAQELLDKPIDMLHEGQPFPLPKSGTKLRGIVWRHFSEKEDDHSTVRCRVPVCNGFEISRGRKDGPKKFLTCTSMKKHVRKVHPELWEPLASEEKARRKEQEQGPIDNKDLENSHSEDTTDCLVETEIKREEKGIQSIAEFKNKQAKEEEGRNKEISLHDNLGINESFMFKASHKEEEEYKLSEDDFKTNRGAFWKYFSEIENDHSTVKCILPGCGVHISRGRKEGPKKKLSCFTMKKHLQKHHPFQWEQLREVNFSK